MTEKDIIDALNSYFLQSWGMVVPEVVTRVSLVIYIIVAFVTVVAFSHAVCLQIDALQCKSRGDMGEYRLSRKESFRGYLIGVTLLAWPIVLPIVIVLAILYWILGLLRLVFPSFDIAIRCLWEGIFQKKVISYDNEDADAWATEARGEFQRPLVFQKTNCNLNEEN